MSVDRRLVFEQSRLFGAVGNGHDVHVFEFRSGFAPITMGQNMMTPNFAAGFNFAALRHCPVKQRVETRDSNAALRRLHVLKESRKAADDFPRTEIVSDPIEFVDTHAGLGGARSPRIWSNFFRCELSLQSQQNVPFVV